MPRDYSLTETRTRHATPAEILLAISEAIYRHNTAQPYDPRRMFPPEAMSIIQAAVAKANREAGQ